MIQYPSYIVAPKLKGKGQKPITNLIGLKVGFLEIINLDDYRTRTRWICRCVCGKEKSILGIHLSRDLIKSCGCKQGELISKAAQTDYMGRSFGRWKVVAGPFHKGPNILWDCVCSCGVRKRVYAGHLAAGNSRSCRCLAIETTKICNRTHGDTVGGHSTEFRTWAGMHDRCRNHKNYADRGIRVCAGWSKFENFLADMGRRPPDKSSIDRIDNGKHYSCGHCEECIEEGYTFNCRWATAYQQSNNRRNNVRVTAFDMAMNASQWDAHLGVHSGRTAARKKKGMTDEKAVK